MTAVLVVDDSRLDRLVHHRWLEAAGYTVLEAESADAGFALAPRADCVLLDYLMLREDGLTAIRRLTAELPHCPPLILLSCALTEDMRRNALALGASACLPKPVTDGATLVAAVRAAIDAHASTESL